MRRIATAFCLVGLAAFTVFALGAGDSSGGKPSYWVALDNAFGLVQGGDMKVAGVRAGKISDLRLDKRTHQALVHFTVNQNGFGSLRADTTCETRPQSLIGEYYLNCEPGTAARRLPENSLIPVTQTTSTVGPDLVNDILRDPYKERLRILLNEFGAAAAGNGANLNAAIRRASPALRETDRVLAILANQNQVLANLAHDGDQVVTALADNKKDVSRFIDASNRAATISATRKAQIAEGFRRLPGFLAELTPAMQALGQVAANTTPALRNLDASAHQLKTFFDQLGPFATASQPALAQLGQASATGTKAVAAATPTVQELTTFSQGVPELAKNLSMVLGHLDDRSFAIEKDPRSPGGAGWTGLEALLNYVFWQSTSVNLFDSNNHLLNIGIFVDPVCSPYPDAKKVAAAAKNPADPLARCISWLGPSQPGVTTPDPTATAKAAPRAKGRQAPTVGAPQAQTPQLGSGAPAPGSPLQQALQNPLKTVGGAVGGAVGGLQQALGKLLNTQQQTPTAESRTQKSLLDYLLSP